MFGLNKFRKYLFLFLIVFPSGLFAQIVASDCSPVRDGKICYTDSVTLSGHNRTDIFRAVRRWAKTEYGKDVFLSNVSVNRDKATVFISTKIELLLTREISTEVKFKLYIGCEHCYYTIQAKDIKYVFEPTLVKKHKVFPAEDVIMGRGKACKVDVIPDPVLFCEGTADYFRNLFAALHQAVNDSLNSSPDSTR